MEKLIVSPGFVKKIEDEQDTQDQAISSNSQAIVNLQDDIETQVVSTLSDFLSLFTENDKVIRVRSTGSLSASLIKHNSRNAIISAWKNGDWIYYNGEDFDGIFGSGFVQISTQTATYYELATKDIIKVTTSSHTTGATGNIALSCVPIVAYADGCLIIPFQGANGANQYLRVLDINTMQPKANATITVTYYYFGTTI